MTSQRYAFEPFASLDGVLRGEPIRIMPVGKFYRGERELDITPDRLKAIAANFKSGLPRFRVPINENHAGVGKVGTVTGVEYVGNGADGPGLYATGYELTDEGQKLVKAKRFDATSPEIVWSLLDGAKYQDPQTGEYHDNVMVGLALTDRPYFSHDNVALFSAHGGAMDDSDMPMPMMKKLKKMMMDMMALFDEKPAPEKAGVDPPVTDAFRTFTAEQRREFAAKGWALADGSYPIENTGDLQNAIGAIGRGDAPHSQIRRHIIKRAKALGAMEMLPEDWRENMSIDKTEVDDMTDKTTTALPVAPVTTTAVSAPETFTVKPEEFAALKAKAEQVDKLTVELGEVKTQADKFRADLDAERKARRHDQLVEKFSALVGFPEKPEALADTMLKLEGMDAEVAKTVTGWIDAADKALVGVGLFNQVGSARGESPAESFEALIEQLHKEKFNSAPDKYNDALELAGKQRPDLMRAYIGH